MWLLSFLGSRICTRPSDQDSTTERKRIEGAAPLGDDDVQVVYLSTFLPDTLQLCESAADTRLQAFNCCMALSNVVQTK
jgi:hypothetical protein